MRSTIFILAMSGLFLQNAFACQPLQAKYWEDSPSRVKANFDNARFVVVATVIDVRTVFESSQLDPNFKMEFERAKFRVDRVFKGKFKPGDTFEIDSGRSSCSRGVQDQDWVHPRKDRHHRQDYPKQWIIYYTPYPEIVGAPFQPPFEITVSPLSRPVGEASYDLRILAKLRGPN